MNSAGRRRRDPVLFIDRDAWSRTLGKALTQAGIEYLGHFERFDAETPDVDWLAVAGRERWVVLTRDQNIRRRPAELAAVKAARIVMFVLGSGNLSATETAQLVIDNHVRLMKTARGARRPAVFTLTRSGSLNRVKLR